MVLSRKESVIDMPNHIDLDILEMGKERYRNASGLNDMERGTETNCIPY